jgi:hypothetical protein
MIGALLPHPGQAWLYTALQTAADDIESILKTKIYKV